MSALAQNILLGRVPSTVPALVGARTINTTRTASSTSSFVNLTFAAFDYGELLAAIAPRPTLLYTPKRDRDATFADVAVCVDEVRPAWGTAGALRNPRPDDYSRLSPEAAAALVEWAKAAVT